VKTASEEVLDLIFLSESSGQTLCAGAELGVFDHMSQGKARTAEEVSAEIELDPGPLHRLLRALTSLGLLQETLEGGFTLTERGILLRTDVAGSLRYLAMLEAGVEHWAIWECVPASIKDGHQKAFLSALGSDAAAGRSDLCSKKLEDQVDPNRIDFLPPHQAKERSSSETKQDHSA
jgi:Dimerisation domain